MARLAEVEREISLISDGGDHKVSLCLAFSLSVNKAQKEPYSFEAVREGEAKRIYENLSPEHYFRIQYQLLPSGGSQPAHVFKTDVVNFGGVVTKIYTDKFSRVIQCWPDFEEEGKGTPNTTNTFSWRHKHRFVVNKASLLKLHSHVVEVRLWSSAKKISTSTRYDRPKIFKLPSQPLPLELRKHPTQYVFVSHDPAKALPKMAKGLKGLGSYPAVASEDSGEPLPSTTASTRVGTTISYGTTSGTADSRDRPTSSVKTYTTHDTASKAPPLSPAAGRDPRIPADAATSVFSVISEHFGGSHGDMAVRAPRTSDLSHLLDQNGTADQNEVSNSIDRSDYTTDHIDATNYAHSPDRDAFRTSPHKQLKATAVPHARHAGGRGKSTNRHGHVPVSRTKSSDYVHRGQEAGKKSREHDRVQAPPSATSDRHLEATDSAEPERATYSETPPSQSTPPPSRSFVDRSGAPVIKVLLDPELFPPMTIPSWKCRRRSIESPMRILPRRSRSLPTSPVRKTKHLFTRRNQQIEVVVDSASPSPSPAGSRLNSAGSTGHHQTHRSHSLSPTRRSLRKITRELSEILARSVQLSKEDIETPTKDWPADGEDDAAVLPPDLEQPPLPTIARSPTRSPVRIHFSPEGTPSPARKSTKQKQEGKRAAVQDKDSMVASQKQVGTSKKDLPEVSSSEAREQGRINKEGLVVLRLKMSELFGTKGLVQTKLEHAIKDVMGFEAGVYLTSPLMPELLVRELRPMAVTVEKVTGLPANPASYQELALRCEPAYVQYQFPLHSVLRTQSLPHAPQLSFRSSNVLLLGTLEDAQFLEFLRGPPLPFELHDRDPRRVQTVTHTIFGQDSLDEVIGTHMFGASLTNGSASKGSETKDARNKSLSPYGVAKFDLSGFLRGGCKVQLTVPVLPSPRLAPYRLPLDAALVPPGNYVDAGCEMTVTLEIWRPLDVLIPGSISWKTTDHDFLSKPSFRTAPSKSSLKKTSSKSLLNESPSRLLLKKTPSTVTASGAVPCPFNRLVYVISSLEGTELLDTVLTKVNAINAATLGLDHLPDKVLHAALSTYKLTKEQLEATDVITGFHVDDFGRHTLVLEGLKNAGIQSLWEACPRHHSQDQALLKVFYNSKFEFSERLYGSLDVDLPKITLSLPLKEIMLQPFIYLQGAIPKSCLRALTCLNWLELVDDMLGITRNGLFPSAEQVASLSLHFSLPAQLPPASAAEGGKDDPQRQHRQPRGNRTREEQVATAVRPMAPNVVPRRRLRRVWTPLEIDNPEFVTSIRHRAKLKKDFLHSNINHCEMLSEISRHHNVERYGRARSSTVPMALTSALPPLSETVHNYSSHTYNSSELRLEELRRTLDPRKRYTFCQDYFHRTISPVKCDRQDKVLREPWRREWLTEEGFVYPGIPSARQCNEHSKKLPPARLQELAQPFQDNVLHSNKLLPTVDRVQFGAANHNLDFDLWTGPQKDPTDPTYVMKWTLERTRPQEEEERKQTEKVKWEEKVVVDDTKFHTLRSSTKTELSNKTPTKMDALASLLKDPPMKRSLRDAYPSDVPPLSVVQYPQLDPYLDMMTLRRESELPLGGYNPGPFEAKSLKLGCNHIPCLGRGKEEEVKKDMSQSVLQGKESVKIYWSSVYSRDPVPTSDLLEANAKRRHRTNSLDNGSFPFRPAMPQLSGRSTREPNLPVLNQQHY